MTTVDEYGRLDTACLIIATGRSLARQLTVALGEHQLSEAEFRLLWRLYAYSADVHQRTFEQSALAEPLGISPAQVSAIVEKLRRQEFISSVAHASDRRRRLWRLTAEGRLRFEWICKRVGRLSSSWRFFELDQAIPSLEKGEAA